MMCRPELAVASEPAVFEPAFNDLNGDGVAEFASVSYAAAESSAGVRVRNGATHADMLVFTPDEAHMLFGEVVLPICDYDGDNTYDYATALLFMDNTNESGISGIRILSGATGKIIAQVEQIDGAPLTHESIKLYGDIDGSGEIDESDLVLFLTNVGESGFDLDLDQNGTTDIYDVLEIADRMGLTAGTAASANVIASIEYADWYLHQSFVAELDLSSELLSTSGPFGTAMCKAWCDEGLGFSKKACYGFCKLLKRNSCVGVQSLCDHLIRHRQKQAAEICLAFYLAMCSGH